MVLRSGHNLKSIHSVFREHESKDMVSNTVQFYTHKILLSGPMRHKSEIPTMRNNVPKMFLYLSA